MADYDQFVHRHGEPVTQALIEDIERRKGFVRFGEPLDVRWKEVLFGPSFITPGALS